MSDDPVAYFLTWTTYGTWLSGDPRGWVDGKTHEMHFIADPAHNEEARGAMTETPITLTRGQRDAITQVIEKHCRIRGWVLDQVNVRTNHAHVVVTCPIKPDRARDQFKAYGTRELKKGDPHRRHWWTEGGSGQYVWNEDDLERVIIYVRDMQ